MTRRYAEDTSVPSERSKVEIETILRRYGASGFLSGYDETRAFIAFKMSDRQCKFFMTLPSPAEERFTHSHGGKRKRYPDAARDAWERGCRQQWRALALVIKAKLEAVAAGITLFEDEFMAHIVLPDGKTVAQHIRPAISQAYTTGKMPPLLPHYGSTS
jgi:hypothetical protein